MYFNVGVNDCEGIESIVSFNEFIINSITKFKCFNKICGNDIEKFLKYKRNYKINKYLINYLFIIIAFGIHRTDRKEKSRILLLEIIYYIEL